ncbi:hypothetical protein QJV44_gp22 [Serratia phage vB_SmaS_Tlacuache]|uniref:Uncharacterized protein n=1 Tax=Serratia phage vB_SmaS_Tlacuache TaxID=2894809 RepID=A0AAE9CEU4_9CAUD|nr:hypothetical protein QJV44_gp22 [Serratia phage vB_SmaS_Tlacuache]UGO51436.1 hypothetical protein TLACUACHE_22 [Serratia phage vB_SmaS_Tlacuache]
MEIVIGPLTENSEGSFFTQNWYKEDTGPSGIRVLFKQDCITGLCSVSLVSGDEDSLEVRETREGLTVDQAREEIERLIGIL